MKLLALFVGLTFLFYTQQLVAQLHVATFGESTKPAVVFLHGGPGYNAASFEFGVAQELSEKGLFVVSFDQRGCGRSAAFTGAYTFEEAMADIDSILTSYGVSSAVFVGHSFGGLLAVKKALQKPTRVSGIVFVGAPLDMSEMFRTVQKNCRLSFQQRKDTISLRSINAVAAMDSTTLMYSTNSFVYAMKAGCYSVPMPTQEAGTVLALLRTKPDAMRWMSNMTMPPVSGFFKNERYTTINFVDSVQKLSASIPMIGLYGEHDGLFDAYSIRRISDAVGGNRVQTVPMASHSVFLDRKTLFIEAVSAFVISLPSKL